MAEAAEIEKKGAMEEDLEGGVEIETGIDPKPTHSALAEDNFIINIISFFL
jgi:hypothetical protein